jgi:hypothetical protein
MYIFLSVVVIVCGGLTALLILIKSHVLKTENDNKIKEIENNYDKFLVSITDLKDDLAKVKMGLKLGR